jgi:hypothetical protein
MMENVNIWWKKNLFNAIKDLADIGFQKAVWLGGSTEYVSSYKEVILSIYDAYFEDFIGKEWDNFQYSDKLHFLMAELNNMISKYAVDKGKEKVEEVILIDPEWIAITEKAKEVINLWKEEDVEIGRVTG